MKTLAQIVSWTALAVVVLAPILYLAGRLELAPMKLWLNAATALWFIATPLWMERGEV